MAPIVQTSAGEVQGIERSYTPPAASGASLTSLAPYSVYEYRGIPYALAPIADRRWALPEPVTSLGARTLMDIIGGSFYKESIFRDPLREKMLVKLFCRNGG